MDEFESLKNKWQHHKTNGATEMKIEELQSKAKQQIVKHQRKLLLSNIFMSLAFSAVFAVIYWVWTSFTDGSIWFYLGMGMMSVLLITFLILQWWGLQYKGKIDAMEPTLFIARTKKQLRHNKIMLLYGVPVYSAILLAAFYIYFFGLLQGASWMYWAGAYGGTTIYVIFIMLISRKKTQKKLAEIREMENYLDEWTLLLKN